MRSKVRGFYCKAEFSEKEHYIGRIYTKLWQNMFKSRRTVTREIWDSNVSVHRTYRRRLKLLDY